MRLTIYAVLVTSLFCAVVFSFLANNEAALQSCLETHSQSVCNYVLR